MMVEIIISSARNGHLKDAEHSAFSISSALESSGIYRNNIFYHDPSEEEYNNDNDNDNDNDKESNQNEKFNQKLEIEGEIENYDDYFMAESPKGTIINEKELFSKSNNNRKILSRNIKTEESYLLTNSASDSGKNELFELGDHHSYDYHDYILTTVQSVSQCNSVGSNTTESTFGVDRRNICYPNNIG